MWTYNQNTLSHHGVKGMRWGIRRYQNKDGSLTPAGKKRMKTLQDAADKAERFKQFSDEEYTRLKKQASKKLSDKEVDEMLYEEFGADYNDRNRKYLKEVLEIDDPRQYIKDRYSGKAIDNLAEREKEIGDTYARISEKFRSMTINDVTPATMKAAKKFIKKEVYAGADYEGDYPWIVKGLREDYLKKETTTKEQRVAQKKELGERIASAALATAIVAIPAFAIIAKMDNTKK